MKADRLPAAKGVAETVPQHHGGSACRKSNEGVVRALEAGRAATIEDESIELRHELLQVQELHIDVLRLNWP